MVLCDQCLHSGLVVNENICLFLYMRMLLLAHIAACKVVTPVSDFMIDFNYLYSLLMPVLWFRVVKNDL